MFATEESWIDTETRLLFVATAIAEIVSCFLPYLSLRKGGAIWLLVPAAASLAIFVLYLRCIQRLAGG